MFFTSLFESNLQTKNIVKDIIYYPNIDSTNDELWRLFENNNFDLKKILVITDNQTSGKGRGQNKWFSQPSKSLTCSFLLDPVFSNNYFKPWYKLS